MDVVTHTIDIPMVTAPTEKDPLPGTMGSHLEIQMNAREAEIFHRMYEALVRQRVTVGVDRHVVHSRTDVLRYFFERLGETRGGGKKAEPKAPKKTAHNA